MPQNLSTWLERTPVIVGVGEITDRPTDREGDLRASKEPLRLMADALLAADEDAGGGWLNRLESLDVINSMTWGYENLPAQLCDSLGVAPKRASYGVIGGSTPLAYLHQAAIRISAGELEVAAVCGAEASHSLLRARQANMALPWTPGFGSPQKPQREGIQHPLVIRHGLTSPLVVYPLYEYASNKYWEQSWEAWQVETAEMWSQFSHVASENPYAWIRRTFEPCEITAVTSSNRLVSGPYTKRMVANPTVNQGGAVLLTSFRAAKQAGVAEHQMIFLWGGCCASEAADIASRDQFTHSTAMNAVLTEGKEIASQTEIALVEFYSCFPCVPKMARRTLNWPEAKDCSVAGGLTFFGGPYNNYMTHATAAMVRKLRKRGSGGGLLYGQGGFLTKHHVLIVSPEPPAKAISATYDAQTEAERSGGPAPLVDEQFAGPVELETYTVLYDKLGEPQYAVVFTRGPNQQRVIARVETSAQAFPLLVDGSKEAVGVKGKTRLGHDGLLRWDI